MSGDKTEWPTKLRIARLRNEGIITYTPFLTRSIILISVLVVALFFVHQLSRLYSDATSQFNNIAQGGNKFSGITLVSRFGIEWLLAFTLTAFIAAILTILIQSKFLFTFSLLSFQPAKALTFLKFNLITTFLGLISRLLKWVFSTLTGVTILWWYAYDLLALLNVERKEWPILLSNFSHHLVLGISCGVFFVGLMAYGVARIVFLQNNRISRKEVDQESE